MRQVIASTKHQVAVLRHRRVQRRMAGPKLLQGFADAYDDPVFVEIGANDGEYLDHLRPFIVERGWRGIMVEPAPHIFERLQRNYDGFERVKLANVAVAERDGEMPFYYLAEAAPEDRAGLPDYYDALGSFSREAVMRHANRIPEIERRIVTTQVPCVTFTTLCRRYGFDRVDLLVIDTEGYDWEIVRSLDLSAYRPRLLIYEHYHLSADDRAAARSHMSTVGYDTMEEGFDTFCLDRSRDDSLSAQWKRVRPAVPGVSKHEQL